MVNKLFLFQEKQLIWTETITGFIQGAKEFRVSRVPSLPARIEGEGGITQTPLAYQPRYQSRDIQDCLSNW